MDRVVPCNPSGCGLLEFAIASVVAGCTDEDEVVVCAVFVFLLVLLEDCRHPPLEPIPEVVIVIVATPLFVLDRRSKVDHGGVRLRSEAGYLTTVP